MLRLGEDYLFPFGRGTILQYSDIVKVYQEIHRTNGVKDRRSIKAELTDEKNITLCNIALFKEPGDQRLTDIVGLLLQKNPGIHIGYR